MPSKKAPARDARLPHGKPSRRPAAVRASRTPCPNCGQWAVIRLGECCAMCGGAEAVAVLDVSQGEPINGGR